MLRYRLECRRPQLLLPGRRSPRYHRWFIRNRGRWLDLSSSIQLDADMDRKLNLGLLLSLALTGAHAGCVEVQA